jgi:hypothetical protein
MVFVFKELKMTKEELIQKEIARILAENPENPVAALRAKRKQEQDSSQAMSGEKIRKKPFSQVVKIFQQIR